MERKQLEKYSSAITLSDMEIFVFPELMYALVLANIMSPIIWKWRESETFKKLQGKGSYRNLIRLRQFVMELYDFNLDLETWGLTTQDVELARFAEYISPQQISDSNALFGYHGDEYYYDVDIRRHFGLDKYNSDVIPYWKTETVEAMEAFKLKEGYKSGAGECVSLAGLYAAAAYIVCGVPLKDIYMLLTPLHSQNYIDVNDGLITNNRRVVTKSMWFNGTAISNKSQRALRNEQVTIVAHNSGYIHCIYDNATIDKGAYISFAGKLSKFLSAEVDPLTIANFLRTYQKYHKYFQFCCENCHGGNKFVKAEVLFEYEHGSKYHIADDTFEKLIDEVSDEDMLLYKHPERMCTTQLCEFLKYENLDVRNQSDVPAIKKYLSPFIEPIDEFIADLIDFIHINPRLPSFEKQYQKGDEINLPIDAQRQQVIEYLQSIRDKSPTVDLAFYVYRDMQSCQWAPFVKASIERCPVSIEHTKDMSDEQVYQWLMGLADSSIYDGYRLATPDEVTNYKTGDGLEKAFVMADVLYKKGNCNIEIISRDGKAVLKADREYRFESAKNLNKKIVMTKEQEQLKIIED
ncbi:MAG TPA: hypothetical protein PLP05_09215 [Sedimentisphaerales bacterium]|nr:hypothetical protein [Sedimentisphaerales bacterium]